MILGVISVKNPFSKVLHETAQQLRQVKVDKYFKVWTSAMDGYSCPECAKLEGAVAPMNGSFVVGKRTVNNPPLHDGCRCSLAFVDIKDLEPALKRYYNAFLEFSSLANDSSDFHAAVSGYFNSLFFLEKIAAASASELRDAGLLLPVGYNLKEQLSVIRSHKDQIFNQAIKRAYDKTMSEVSSFKTEKRKRERLLRLKESILSDADSLSGSNIAFLNELISS